MSLRCLVKISSVNNLSDARYTAGMGVELMGFDLDPESENFIDPDQFNAITSWVSGVKLVAELGEIPPVTAQQVLQDYKVNYVQLGPGLPLDQLEAFQLPVIIKIDQPDRDHISRVLLEYDTFPWSYLLEPDQPMTEKLLQWSTEKAKQYPLILGSNVSADNVDEMLQAGFNGIALRGGHEIRPGYKNFDELANILEALEINE